MVKSLGVTSYYYHWWLNCPPSNHFCGRGGDTKTLLLEDYKLMDQILVNRSWFENKYRVFEIPY